MSHAQKNALQTYQLLYVAQLDLSQAAFFADYLLTQGWHFEPWEVNWKKYLHQGAYVTSMVVAYSRPFTESRGWPKFPKKILRVLSPKEKDLHNRLLTLRNEVYAHSDIESRKIRPITIGGKPSAFEVLPPMRFNSTELAEIRVMIRTISLAIKEKVDELSATVAEHHYDMN